MHLDALPPVSGGQESPVVALGRDLLQSLTQVYIARRTGQVPPPGYMTIPQAQAAQAAARPAQPGRAPNVMMVAGIALGAVVLLRMLRRR